MEVFMVSTIQLGNFYNSGGKTVMGGGASGIDTESLITGLTDAKRIPAVKLEEDLESNANKITAFSDFKQLLATFQASVNTLRNPPGVGNDADDLFSYVSATTTSSSAIPADSYISVSTQPGSSAGSFDITEITSVASAKKQTINEVFAISDQYQQVVHTTPGAGQLGAGDISINGTTITLEDGDSLYDVAAKFNAVSSDTGIEASFLKQADNAYKIVFSATETGTNADFDMAALDTNSLFSQFTFATTQTASDAVFIMDGITFTRQSNTVDDVVDGVTFALKQKMTDGTNLYIDVDPDTETIKNGIVAMIDSYNELKVFYAKQTEMGDDGKPLEESHLASNSTASNIMMNIGDILSGVVKGIVDEEFNNLSDIGITFTDYEGDAETPEIANAMTLDIQKLDNVLKNNFEEVRKVFEFDFTSDSSKLQVFSRANSVSLSSFELQIDVGAMIAKAVSGETVIDLEINAITGGSGYSIDGLEGTDLEGLELIYTGSTNDNINVTMSMGIADAMYNELDSSLDEESGSLTMEMTSLSEKNERYEEEITRIDARIESYRDMLLLKFSILEQAITSVNTILMTLDAQAQARQANS